MLGGRVVFLKYISLFFLERNCKAGNVWFAFIYVEVIWSVWFLSLTCGFDCCYMKSKVGTWLRSSMVALLEATSVTCDHFHLPSDMSFPTSNEISHSVRLYASFLLPCMSSMSWKTGLRWWNFSNVLSSVTIFIQETSFHASALVLMDVCV